MKKFVVVLLILSGFYVSVSAQMYTSSVGIRMGGENGLTLKHFINENTAIEGLASFRYIGSIHLTGLYEVHNLAFDIDGLFWYYGGGVHAGFGNPNTNDFVAGIDGILGIEYTFRDFPFNVSLDFKPAFDVVGNFYPWVGGTALSVRYVFK